MASLVSLSSPHRPPTDQLPDLLHRGCVTPRVISHMQEVLGEPGEDGEYDASAVDGFEELSSENQEKVLRALKQGHVEDSEWRGVSFSVTPLTVMNLRLIMN